MFPDLRARAHGGWGEPSTGPAAGPHETGARAQDYGGEIDENPYRPAGSARRWTRRRANRLMVRLTIDDGVTWCVMRRIGLGRWLVTWGLRR